MAFKAYQEDLELAGVVVPGVEVKRGDRIRDFRGETWEFQYVSRDPSPGKGGKVVVSVPTVNGGGEREFYPSVFNLVLKEG